MNDLSGARQPHQRHRDSICIWWTAVTLDLTADAQAATGGWLAERRHG
jgi:hypothetical protein